MRNHAAAVLALLGLLGACRAVPDRRPLGAVQERKARKAALGLTPSGEPFKPFAVYANNPRRTHYVTSGYMGDSDLSLSGSYTPPPRGEGTCLKVTYRAGGVKGWAGIIWQDPANNWGETPGRTGYDLRGATRLTFWARGENGGEKVVKFCMGMMGSGAYPDSDLACVENVRLTKEWKMYAIDLKGKDLRHIIGGFGFTVVKDENHGGMVFYLADIIYDAPETVHRLTSKPVETPSVPTTASLPEATPSPAAAAPPPPPASAPLPETGDLNVKEDGQGLKVSFSSQFLFAPGRAILEPGSGRMLEQLVALLKAYPSNPVLIEGHTDGTGNSDFNLKLSQLRAEAVRDYLLKKDGYEASRFKVVGYGATRPVADNRTKAGRALNRRVEVTILKGPTP